MRGMSSATRRFRTSPPPLNRFPSVPAGGDDEYLKGYHIKRMRLRKRTLSKFVRLRLRKECIMPLIYISFTVLLVMNVSNNHLRSSSKRPSLIIDKHPINLRFLNFIKQHDAFTFIYPKPLIGKALDGVPGKDRGGLYVDIFQPDACPESGCKRQIYHDFRLDETKKDRGDPDEGTYDNYYAFDDDKLRNPFARYSRDKRDLERKCRRVNWHRFNPINCNNIHELDFRSAIERGQTKFIGAGSYRQVYLTDVGSEKFILKTFSKETDYNMADFEYMRMDSIVAERLSSSDKIVDIFAFCGLTNINEPMMNGDLEKAAQPHGLRAPEIKLDDKEHLDPHNDYLPSQKLDYALQMAEAVAVLHSYPGGVIVHDDIQMSQFLFTSDMRLKLNDFNRAEMMTFDVDANEYCKYTNNPGHGDWRAPEEYFDYPLNEKIDVYSLGNSFYALLTGVSIFYELSFVEEKEIHKKVKAGERPFVDPRWRKKSFAERKLIEIMEQMWTHHPDKRIDIFGVVSFLRDALKETRRSYLHEDQHQNT